MKLRFWGTRGSIPVPGKSTLKYGGNTPCIELRSKSNDIIILDAGSGIRELGNQLLAEKYAGEINIFISHYHWDHIQGIPFFLPLYRNNHTVNFFGSAAEGYGIEKLLSVQLQPDFFPVKKEEFGAEVKYHKILPGKTVPLKSIDVETIEVFHPSQTLAFKVTEGKKSIVYMTDNEIELDGKESTTKNISEANNNLIEFCRGCDYLIHDSMYEESEFKDKIGWGHSSNLTLAKFSALAKVKNLVLFHYNPDYSDKKIDELFKETKNSLKSMRVKTTCLAAREGMVLEL